MSEWISTKDKAPKQPCLIVTESDSMPRMPRGIYTFVFENGETLYFDGEISDFFEWANENEGSITVKGNNINYWLPIPTSPCDEQIHVTLDADDLFDDDKNIDG